MALILSFIVVILILIYTIAYFSKSLIDHYLKSLSEKSVPPYSNILKQPARAVQQTGKISLTENHYDAIVIGSGVVGSSLAICLAKQNRKVLVIERELGEHVDKGKIIGELLQPGGAIMVKNLGLENALLDTEKSYIDGYRIHVGDRTIESEYPKNQSGVVMEGMGFHMYKFVQSLRDEMKKFNIELVEGNATRLHSDKLGIVNGVEYTLNPAEKNENEDSKACRKSFADLVFVCDGCFSSFRMPEQKRNIEIYGYFLGLCLEDCHLKQPKKANLYVSSDCKILLYPIGNNEWRLLIDFKGKISRKSLTPQFFEGIKKIIPSEAHIPFEKAVSSKNYRIMPNQVLSAMDYEMNRFVYVGDSFNMRHPLTGAGMTVGLTDVYCLNRCLEDLPDFTDLKTVQNRIRKFCSMKKAQSGTLNVLACALYQIVDKENTAFINAFYEYICQGGFKEKGPMRLLSGISRNETELFLHFISVVVLAAKTQLGGSFSPYKLLAAYRLLRKGFEILTPLVEKEGLTWQIRYTCLLGKMIFYVNL